MSFPVSFRQHYRSGQIPAGRGAFAVRDDPMRIEAVASGARMGMPP